MNVKGKNVITKRIAALEAAGIEVVYVGIKWNFGKVGTFKKDLIQLGCATGGRGKNNYSVNACPVWRIK